MITKRINVNEKVIGKYKTGDELIYNNNREKIIGFIVSEDTKKVSLIITNQTSTWSSPLLGHVSRKISRFDFEDETLYYTCNCNQWKIIETDVNEKKERV
jgi:hypothetical protein